MTVPSSHVKLSDVRKAVQREFEGLVAFKQVQGGTTLTDGVPEVAMLQVYFEKKRTSAQGKTDRVTMGSRESSPIRTSAMTIYIDVYARVRSHIGPDMAAVEDLADEVDSVLERQNASPFFDFAPIKAFSYSAERVTFEYGKVSYAGIRFVLDLTIF